MSVLNKGVLATNYATRLQTLGLIYQEQTKYDMAEKLYLEAIEIDKKTIGENHSDYAINLNNLGIIYYEWGKKEDDIIKIGLAQKYLEQALKISLEKLGPDHPNTKHVQSSLDYVKTEM